MGKPFSWPEGKRAAVSFSFDDARVSQVDRGFPILDALGVRATFYVSANSVKERLSAWRSAVELGHEAGNHTMTHPCSGNFPFARGNALEDYDLQRMEAELVDANAVIHDLLGVTPTTFAFPCGQKFVGRGLGVKSYVPLVAKHFLVGRSAFNETHNDPTFVDLAQIESLDADDAPAEGLIGLADAALAEGGWLVFMGHDVGDRGRQTVGEDALEALCRYALAPENGLWIDTVAAVGGHIQEARNGSEDPS